MTDKSQIYLARIKRCMLTLRITVILSMAAVAALVVFTCFGTTSGMREDNPQGFLIGIVITAGLSAGFVIASFTALIIAKITLNKLNKLDTREAQS